MKKTFKSKIDSKAIKLVNKGKFRTIGHEAKFTWTIDCDINYLGFFGCSFSISDIKIKIWHVDSSQETIIATEDFERVRKGEAYQLLRSFEFTPDGDCFPCGIKIDFKSRVVYVE